MSANPFDRDIPFEECTNFRDLGGYVTVDGRRVRWRVLFRSGQLHGMTEGDVQTAGVDLGIKTVIDLRRPEEIAQQGIGPLGDPLFDHHRVSLRPDEDESVIQERLRALTRIADHYAPWIGDPIFGSGVAQVLSAIIRPGALPALFHCNAGKDRTGMVAAVILGILGVSDEDIVADYALSDIHMQAIRERVLSNPDTARQMEGLPEIAIEALFSAPPEAMEHVLETVRKEHGTMRQYVGSYGVGNNVIRSLQDALLES